jgi:hypothetical protein
MDSNISSSSKKFWNTLSDKSRTLIKPVTGDGMMSDEILLRLTVIISR